MHSTPSLFQRLKSRKFLVTLFAQIVALLVLLFPQHEEAIRGWESTLVPLILMALTSVGYVVSEAAVDKARAKGETEGARLVEAAERISNAAAAEGIEKRGSARNVSGHASVGILALLAAVGATLVGCVQGVPAQPVKTFADTVGEDHREIVAGPNAQPPYHGVVITTQDQKTGEEWVVTLDADQATTRIAYIDEFQALVNDIHADQLGGTVIPMPE